jgi:hypothetical protein
MSGGLLIGLLINAVLRETGHKITSKDAASLQEYHAEGHPLSLATNTQARKM